MTLDDIVWWHWWVAALIFLTLEALMPGAVFLWMGASALATGLIGLLLPALGWPFEFIIFGVLAIVAVLAWRRWRPARTASNEPSLNRRGESYVGRHFTLSEPLIDGIGTLRVDDSQWRISSPDDLPAGVQVRVVAADGATLRVEPLR